MSTIDIHFPETIFKLNMFKKQGRSQDTSSAEEHEQKKPASDVRGLSGSF